MGYWFVLIAIIAMPLTMLAISNGLTTHDLIARYFPIELAILGFIVGGVVIYRMFSCVNRKAN
jgi:uncharacterized integral membrane protein